MLHEEIRRLLIGAAAERRTVTYGELMRFGVSRGTTGGDTVIGVLGQIDKREQEQGAPGFAAIVVRKDTGYPGGGFFCWEDIPVHLRRRKGEGMNPKLSEAEKAYVRELQGKIWRYYAEHRAHQSSLDGD